MLYDAIEDHPCDPEMADESRFWMIYGHDRIFASQFKNRVFAQEAAEGLAKDYPNEVFYVLKAMTRVSSQVLVTSERIF
jgi:hypothetical protein